MLLLSVKKGIFKHFLTNNGFKFAIGQGKTDLYLVQVEAKSIFTIASCRFSQHCFVFSSLCAIDGEKMQSKTRLFCYRNNTLRGL